MGRECWHESGEAVGVPLAQPPLNTPRSSWRASEKQMPGWDETCKNFPREVPVRKVERGEVSCGMAVRPREGSVELSQNHRAMAGP